MDFFFGFLFGLAAPSIAGWLSLGKSRECGQSKPKHHEPMYHGYSGGWANVCECRCGSVSLYEDNHPIDPCIDCGSKEERKKRSAKWVGFWEFNDK